MVKQCWRLARETWNRWGRNNGSLLASSLAFYAAFSLFPLLLILIAGLGYTLRFSADAQSARDEFLNVVARSASPVLATEIRSILADVKSNAGVSGPLGLVTLLLGAIGIFAQLEGSFAQIWHDPSPRTTGIAGVIREVLQQRLKAFLTLLGLGLLIVAGFVAGLLMTALQSSTPVLPGSRVGWQFLHTTAGLVLNGLVFTLLYRLLPKVRVDWHDAVSGGVVVAIVWEIGREALAFAVVRGNYGAYGVVGSFIAVMLWIYCTCNLLFLGAQLVQVLGYPDDKPRE